VIFCTVMVHINTYFRVDAMQVIYVLSFVRKLIFREDRMSRLVTFKLSRRHLFNFPVLFLLCFSHGTFAQPHIAEERDVRNCQYLVK